MLWIKGALGDYSASGHKGKCYVCESVDENEWRWTANYRGILEAYGLAENAEEAIHSAEDFINRVHLLVEVYDAYKPSGEEV